MFREAIDQLLAAIRGAWRYRWLALSLAWGIAMAGWLWVLMLPDEYEAKTQVYVDTESALLPLVEGLAVRTDVMTEVNMMTVVLVSRPQLERVARDTDLDLRATDAREWEMLIRELRKRIRIGGDARRNLYEIQYYDEDRDMALKVVRSLLNVFVEDTLGETTQDNTAAERFLLQQKAEYEQRLREDEQALADFKKANVGVMPSDRGDYYARLQAALAEIEYTQSQLSSAATRRNELRRQIAGEEPVFDIMPGSTGGAGGTSHDATIVNLEAQLANALLRYTEKHPDVTGLRETIAQLEEKRRQEIMAMGGGIAPGLAENPVYQQMRIGLSEAEVEVVSLQAQLGQQRKRADELKRLVDTVPEVEAQLAELTRGYEITSRTYEDIRRRLERAQMSRDVAQAQPVGFRIIEPPAALLEPVAPNRPVLMSLMLVGGLAAGIALALFLSQVHPVFSDRRQLRAVTGLPVLGTIHLITTAAERARRRVALGSFALGFASLIGALAVAVMFAGSGARFLQQLVG